MLLHQKIRKWRKESDLSQEWVAGELGITQPAYSDIENGKTKITEALKKKLSIILGVPLEKFKDDDGTDEIKVLLMKKEIEHLKEMNTELRKENAYLEKIVELQGGKRE